MTYARENCLNVCKQINDLIEFLVRRSNTWNHLTVWKRMSSDSFKNVINKMCLQIIFI